MQKMMVTLVALGVLLGVFGVVWHRMRRKRHQWMPGASHAR